MLFTHCYGHALNLAIKDTCFKVDYLKETFETVNEICNLVEKSSQRDTKLTDLPGKFENESSLTNIEAIERRRCQALIHGENSMLLLRSLLFVFYHIKCTFIEILWVVLSF